MYYVPTKEVNSKINTADTTAWWINVFLIIRAVWLLNKRPWRGERKKLSLPRYGRQIFPEKYRPYWFHKKDLIVLI